MLDQLIMHVKRAGKVKRKKEVEGRKERKMEREKMIKGRAQAHKGTPTFRSVSVSQSCARMA